MTRIKSGTHVVQTGVDYEKEVFRGSLKDCTEYMEKLECDARIVFIRISP